MKFPTFLQPEVFPYASVEIIPAAEQTIEETERARFHRFLTDPKTGPRLDALLAESGRVDAAPTVCAWCPDFQPSTSAGVSHGICPACAARFGAEDLAMVPVDPARDTAVVDVRLEVLEDEAPREEDCGAACSSWCGYCGMCS